MSNKLRRRVRLTDNDRYVLAQLVKELEEKDLDPVPTCVVERARILRGVEGSKTATSAIEIAQLALRTVHLRAEFGVTGRGL